MQVYGNLPVGMNVTELKAVVPRQIRRPLGVTRRWFRARPSRTLRQKMQLLKSNSLKPNEIDLLSRVASRISPDDGMYAGDGEHYFRVGLSAIECIDEALINARIESVRNILDMPCGFGRVLRFLSQRFPEARIIACDLMPDAVAFCAQTFEAEPARSSEDLTNLSFDTTFDLIWCGSLFTHLDQGGIASLLNLFRRSLAPNGLAVFTTQGERVGHRMISGEFDYSIAKKDVPLIVDSYRQTGYGFATYPDVTEYSVSENNRYGISLTAPDWIRAQAKTIGGLREVYFRAHGWDDHQDVFGFVRQD
jgi:SAM-dependent methyltransferase